MNNIRVGRISSEVLRELSQIMILEARDETLKHVTLTGCEVTNDLSYAKVYFTTLNEDKEKVKKDINNAKGFIRSLLMKKKIEMRVIPELNFVYDESIDYGNKIENIIEKIHEKDDN